MNARVKGNVPGDESQSTSIGSAPAEDGDPGRERRASFRQAGPEVPREGKLQRDPGAERDREHERTDQGGKDARTACERKRERHEARGTPRLRDRDGVGEMRKDPDEELDPEHGEGSAEDECGPPLS